MQEQASLLRMKHAEALSPLVVVVFLTNNEESRVAITSEGIQMFR